MVGSKFMVVDNSFDKKKVDNKVENRVGDVGIGGKIDGVVHEE